MQFGVQQPEPSINQKAAQSSQSSLSLNIPIDKLPGNNSLFPQVLKISPRQPAAKQGTKSNYTTTYNASYQKPFWEQNEMNHIGIAGSFFVAES